MIKKSLVLFTVASAFFVKAQDVSTIKNTVDIYSNGNLPATAKYNAMAGSMGALGGDVSVLNINSAGLGVAIASDLSGTLSVIKNKNTTTFGNNSKEYQINETSLGHTGGIVSFSLPNTSPWKFVNIGVNYSTRSIENYSESPVNSAINVNGIDNKKGDYTFVVRRHAYDRRGLYTKMSVGIGGNYENKLYVGTGLNFHTVSIEQSDTAEFTDGSSSESFSKQFTPFSEYSNGFSANIGVIGKINNQFRLGASIETPIWYNLERDYAMYGRRYAEDRKLTTPFKTTLSAAYVPNKNLAVNIDYSLGLSKLKYSVMGNAEEELNDFFNAHYKNVSEFRVGTEYRIKALRIRGGYSFASNPLNTIGADVYNPSGNGITAMSYNNLMVSKRNTLGLGLGYDFKSFYVDAAYQNISMIYDDPFLFGESKDSEVFGYIYNIYASNSSAYAVSNVKNNINNFTFTLGWKF